MIYTIRVVSDNNVYQKSPKIVTAKIYRIEGIRENQAKILAEKLFCEKINQKYSLNKSILKNVSFIAEVAYKPGVMNPEVASIIKAAKDLGINVKAADSSTEYGFTQNIKKEKIEEVVRKLNLFNPTVEYLVKIQPKTLIIKGVSGKTTTVPIRKMDNTELAEVSKDKLFLNLEEIKIIQKYFFNLRRDPKDIELETLAQTWSEHCAHKT
ncbi:phosphoribosylformylglycinamidine synthase, partial [Candidatus Roizmanbacteria bacterium]|nr:phosphoribosylformylglycinamidine synthase [Candidatus Roizmanbacteria bacterium]